MFEKYADEGEELWSVIELGWELEEEARVEGVPCLVGIDIVSLKWNSSSRGSSCILVGSLKEWNDTGRLSMRLLLDSKGSKSSIGSWHILSGSSKKERRSAGELFGGVLIESRIEIEVPLVEQHVGAEKTEFAWFISESVKLPIGDMSYVLRYLPLESPSTGDTSALQW